MVLSSVGNPKRVSEAVAECDEVFDLTRSDASRGGRADGQHDGGCEIEPVDHISSSRCRYVGDG